MSHKANEAARPATVRQAVVVCVGVSAALLCVGWLGSATNVLLVLGSFGSSCVLLFGFPQSSFSQPRNFVAGHFLATFTGLMFYQFVGPQWWAMALAAGAACGLMMVTRTLHPPAGSNPLIVYLAHPDWQFLWFPTLAGAIVVQAVAIIYHRATSRTVYPVYWVAPSAINAPLRVPPGPGTRALPRQ